MGATTVRLVRTVLLMLVLVDGAAAGAQRAAGTTSARARQEAPRGADTASARSRAEGSNASGGDRLGGAVRRAAAGVRAMGAAPRETRNEAFSMPTSFDEVERRFGPWGKELAIIGMFALFLWGVLNPKSFLILACWAAGFWIVQFAYTRGHLYVGVGVAFAYWLALHWLGERSSRKYRRRTVYKPSEG